MLKKRPKLVILSSNYPSYENHYGDGFVHSRLKYYTIDFDIVVIGYRPFEASRNYVYEGITVHNHSRKSDFVADIDAEKPDVMGIHFVGGWFYDAFLKKLTIPVFIWVHGEEALGWYRRMYYMNWKKIREFLTYVAKNVFQLFHLRRIIRHSNKNSNIKFIFVSEWMKKIAETDTFCKIKHFNIIPNPIDTSLFQYKEKTLEKSRKILLIRSFETRKYANDIAVAAINLLRAKEIFPTLQFDIYGKGKFYDKITASVADLENVNLHNHLIPNHEIPAVHSEFGIFLCPTRQDAQGVSMCEAMSSGLVPVTTDNTAIPEFVENGKTGYLTSNAEELALAIEKLVNDYPQFSYISKNASEAIKLKSGHETVIAAELKLLNEGV
ncbi:glycosyltransferase family 4 protein [Chitinophaga sp. 22321]|uniref:Glycosyltransferase family 4 protein n=1 Tax=Chitinophaga hostae TaxID=2831022 RepID=A0ABS5IZZ5_9BACT|nr:glycosyltransferase family 4 protein [Chitinophaga hostae]MBS0028548.1 glycosyltransferase family 4 protein [Chitinophaga hostae]